MLYPLSYGSVTSLLQSCSITSSGQDIEQGDTLMLGLASGNDRAVLSVSEFEKHLREVL